MSVIIEVQRLSRKFKEVSAVDDISFYVERGEIFGFLGANGAGKTTTVRMLTGFISPSSGEITVDGHNVINDPVRARRRIGVVPEEANVYGDLSVWNNVMLMAGLYGVPKKTARTRAEALLSRFGLIERKKEKGRVLSKGLKQRLITEINNEQETTVFLTTHNMREAEGLCTRVAIMNKGKIAAIDRPEVLRDTVDSVNVLEPGLEEVFIKLTSDNGGTIRGGE